MEFAQKERGGATAQVEEVMENLHDIMIVLLHLLLEKEGKRAIEKRRTDLHSFGIP